mmetsp:Transcript_64720/g.179829  ORF Transcript_64720/g.179829 Transcript_64720/m.179829 type:complete len:203 (+) Transcript_64720:78-686(+)
MTVHSRQMTVHSRQMTIVVAGHSPSRYLSLPVSSPKAPSPSLVLPPPSSYHPHMSDSWPSDSIPQLLSPVSEPWCDPSGERFMPPLPPILAARSPPLPPGPCRRCSEVLLLERTVPPMETRLMLLPPVLASPRVMPGVSLEPEWWRWPCANSRFIPSPFFCWITKSLFLSHSRSRASCMSASLPPKITSPFVLSFVVPPAVG